MYGHIQEKAQAIAHQEEVLHDRAFYVAIDLIFGVLPPLIYLLLYTRPQPLDAWSVTHLRMSTFNFNQ